MRTPFNAVPWVARVPTFSPKSEYETAPKNSFQQDLRWRMRDGKVHENREVGGHVVPGCDRSTALKLTHIKVKDLTGKGNGNYLGESPVFSNLFPVFVLITLFL